VLDYFSDITRSAKCQKLRIVSGVSFVKRQQQMDQHCWRVLPYLKLEMGKRLDQKVIFARIVLA
jgi:hypothetical protein